MTTKNNKRPSLPNDPYYTPGWVVDQAIEHIVPLVCPVPARILEPGAGRGAFVKRLRSRYYGAHITAVDIEPFDWPEATVSVHADFLSAALGSFDLAIGNPPFSLAMPFIQRCLNTAVCTVMLVRQGFLSSKNRNTFWRMHGPCDVFILAHRPSFVVEGGGDSADYCFVCWSRHRKEGITRLHWLPTVPLAARK